MATELVQFGIVMGAVIFGFAMAFFSLFRELDGLTLRTSVLKVFKAMLGDTGFFDDFTGTRFDEVATLLLVFYLIIMTIMLLNLLIAVLSTAHANVEHSVLIRVSAARLFMSYRRVTAIDILPAPFNLVQFVVVFPCGIVDFALKTKTRATAKRLIGRIIFWLIMGPMAILGGSILWLLSLPKAMLVVWGAQIPQNCSFLLKLARTLFCVIWTLIGVPTFLVLAWLSQAPRVLTGKTFSLEAASPPREFPITVDGLLKEATGGMGMADLRAYIRDPVNNSNACYSNLGWQDKATTLGHVKTLGQWLDTSTQERIDKLKAGLQEKVAATTEKVAATEEIVGRLEAKIDRLHTMLST